MIHFRAGDPLTSRGFFRDAIRLYRRMGTVGRLPYVKMGAALELQLGHPERAARLAGAAAQAVEDLGGELPAAMIGMIDPLAEARSLLPADVYQREVALGRAMSFDEATAYVLADDPTPDGGTVQD